MSEKRLRFLSLVKRVTQSGADTPPLTSRAFLIIYAICAKEAERNAKEARR